MNTCRGEEDGSSSPLVMNAVTLFQALPVYVRARSVTTSAGG